MGTPVTVWIALEGLTLDLLIQKGVSPPLLARITGCLVHGSIEPAIGCHLVQLLMM